MTLLAHILSIFAGVTFFQICLALIVVAVIERALYLLPESVVGEGGWLLDTGRAE